MRKFDYRARGVTSVYKQALTLCLEHQPADPIEDWLRQIMARSREIRNCPACNTATRVNILADIASPKSKLIAHEIAATRRRLSVEVHRWDYQRNHVRAGKDWNGVPVLRVIPTKPFNKHHASSPASCLTCWQAREKIYRENTKG